MKIRFERLISRSVVNLFQSELKLAGVKMDINKFLKMLVIGGVAMFAIAPVFHISRLGSVKAGIAALAGFVAAAVFEVVVYAFLEFKIEQRKDYMETCFRITCSSSQQTSGAE